MEIPGLLREDLGTVVRYTPKSPDANGLLCFTNLSEHDMQEQVPRQISYFSERNLGFEWKLYDFDRPHDLKSALLEFGFEEDDPEALMIYDVSRFKPASAAGSCPAEIRRISDPADLDSIVALQELIWNRSFPWLFEQLRSMFAHADFFGAYREGVLIGSGWIEYPADSRFAEIHGGAVCSAFRGMGIYSRLFESRMLAARERGVPFVTVDAAPMSRPILEARGFEWLSGTYPLTWVRPGGTNHSTGAL